MEPAYPRPPAAWASSLEQQHGAHVTFCHNLLALDLASIALIDAYGHCLVD